MSDSFRDAVILGVVEGLTEFLPVSSTGHLILVDRLFAFAASPAFMVMIQLGAILAVCVAYFPTLWRTLIGLPREGRARRFAGGILIAFLPAAVLGLLLGDFIEEVLFSPLVVCAALIVGGIAILVIERIKPVPVHTDSESLPFTTCLAVGLCQTLALVPGVSRAGATILGALLFRVERKAAAEFSFFLAIPTMLGAFVYEAYKYRETLLAGDGLPMIAVGFVVAFFSALLIVRTFIGFVGRYGFAPFAWYRIVVGIIGAIVFLR